MDFYNQSQDLSSDIRTREQYNAAVRQYLLSHCSFTLEDTLSDTPNIDLNLPTETQISLVDAFPSITPRPIAPGSIPYLSLIDQAAGPHGDNFDFYGLATARFRAMNKEFHARQEYEKYVASSHVASGCPFAEHLRHKWFEALSEMIRAQMAYAHAQSTTTESLQRAVDQCVDSILRYEYERLGKTYDDHAIERLRAALGVYRDWVRERCVMFPSESARLRETIRDYRETSMKPILAQKALVEGIHGEGAWAKLVNFYREEEEARRVEQQRREAWAVEMGLREYGGGLPSFPDDGECPACRHEADMEGSEVTLRLDYKHTCGPMRY